MKISQHYIFRNNGVFHHYETYNDTLINSYIRGDYLFKPDERILILLVNEKGDTLFIVEAMKVFNEITAPVSGIIKMIHIQDESMVEYGQVVMEIEE